MEYRFDSDYQELLKITKSMSKDFEEDSQLKSQVGVCERKKKCQFVYENLDESPQSPENNFLINVFLHNFGLFIGFIE